MPDPVITHLEQVTPEWLTEVLTRNGALAQGSVAAIDVETGRSVWSTTARLRVRYVEGAQGARPRRLFLKLVNADLGDGESFDDSEVNYYTRDYVGVAGAPLVRCYSAAFSGSLKRYHLLLDDLSETHVAAAARAPTPEYGLALAEGLAVMHAHWWGAARLAQAGAAWHSAQHIQRFVEFAEPGAGHILQHVSDQLEPHWPEMIRTLYARHSAALVARARDAEGFSLIHGDTNVTNILVPRAGDRPIYLIDRQPFAWSLTTWLGVYDLAYALVLDWDVETRRRLERPVLQRYHRGLLEHGVSGYPWERLWDDYRLSAAMGVYIATEYCRGGLNLRAQKWWLPKLQRSLTACDDLHCRAQW